MHPNNLAAISDIVSSKLLDLSKDKNFKFIDKNTFKDVNYANPLGNLDMVLVREKTPYSVYGLGFSWTDKHNNRSFGIRLMPKNHEWVVTDLYENFYDICPKQWCSKNEQHNNVVFTEKSAYFAGTHIDPTTGEIIFIYPPGALDKYDPQGNMVSKHDVIDDVNVNLDKKIIKSINGDLELASDKGGDIGMVLYYNTARTTLNGLTNSAIINKLGGFYE